MTALPTDAVADLKKVIVGLERQLQSALTENNRLQAELGTARDRQSASADILQTIAGAAGDAERSLIQIAETTMRLFGAPSATIHIAQGDGWSQVIRVGASSKRVGAGVPEAQLKIGGRNMPGTIVAENRQVHVPDVDRVDPEIADWPGLPYVRAAGTRSMSGSPLRCEGRAIGALIVYRDQLAPFTDEEMALQQSFADQAAIAIENARLFKETREALERQAATAEILKVMASSPSDVQPVFDAIAVNANRLIGGFSTAVLRYIDGAAHLAAFTPTDPAGDRVLQAAFPVPFAHFPPYQLVADGTAAQLPDTELEPAARDVARARGYRSMLFVPLVSEGQAIGVVIATRRTTGAFDEHHVRLLQTFADQAVIAIKNVDLFNATREALERQTATAEILNVIASSPIDVQPVFDAIAESARRLLGGQTGLVTRVVDDALHLAAHTTGSEAGDRELANSFPAPLTSSGIHSRAARTSTIAFRTDIETESDVSQRVKDMARARGYRSIIVVPMLREGLAIGTIGVSRAEPGPFADNQIDLLRTFADQAVIAIANVRLFDEVQAKTRDLSEALTYQTGSANILKVIASSPTEVGPVLTAIVESACELCEAYDAVLRLKVGDDLRLSAHHGPIATFLDNWPTNRNWTAGRSAIDQKPVQVTDMLSSEGDDFPEAKELARRQGYRSILSVPLLREGESIGAISLRRLEVNPFTDKQIAQLQTFADQAVIAIGNARLFEEVQARTKELSQSLDELRTAQDRLVQTEKLASLGQLTAGIAHEIKNPLNFVNNFAALSTELTDELNDVLKQAEIGDKIREEVDELTGMLKDNLQKVVQHGKRADSIVKNMLLHSREGFDDRRPADINALVDESLNLAYHGARAEKPNFNVTLRRDFDPAAGMVEMFPQEITRVILNLVSNGFYAVTKRRNENGGPAFDPVLTAATRNLGDRVEIRIRDNGTGIPPDVKEKMFNPFFTTKPAGEGTGLGLSMSHDIIVKQHGGAIEVDTEAGQFTEFRIVLPRTSQPQDKNRGQT